MTQLERSELPSREEVLKIAVKCGLVSTMNLADALPEHYIKTIERFAAAMYEAGADAKRVCSKGLSYWLIERNQLHGEPSARWFSERKCFAQGEQDIWVQDVARAARFISKEFAEQSIIARFAGDERYPVLPVATEHLDVRMVGAAEHSAMQADGWRQCAFQSCADCAAEVAAERAVSDRLLEKMKVLARYATVDGDAWVKREASASIAEVESMRAQQAAMRKEQE